MLAPIIFITVVLLFNLAIAAPPHKHWPANQSDMEFASNKLTSKMKSAPFKLQILFLSSTNVDLLNQIQTLFSKQKCIV